MSGLKIIDIATKKTIGSLGGNLKNIYHLVVSKDEKTIYSSTATKYFSITDISDINNLKILSTMEEFTDNNGLLLNKDETILFLTDDN